MPSENKKKMNCRKNDRFFSYDLLPSDTEFRHLLISNKVSSDGLKF